MPTDNPDVYGSYMNFFLPQQARVGSSGASTPGLFDMLGGNLASSMSGLGGWGGTPSGAGTTSDQQKKQQQQGMAMGQQGMKMLQPLPPPPVPQMMPNTAPPPQQMPPATQVTPSAQPQLQTGYDPRDPRSRNPMAGMPTPFGGFYR